MSHGKAVDGQDGFGRCGAGDACDVHQTVIGAVQGFQGRIDAAGVGQVDLDVTGDRRGGPIAVQAGDGCPAGEELFGDGVPDPRCSPGDDEVFSAEFRHVFL